MLIVPAIDIIDGQCVRLTKGDYLTKKVYLDDVIGLAKIFEMKGAGMIHIIDLDAAKRAWPVNMSLILKIVRQLSIPVQVGGGIRTFEVARRYLDLGVNRIIIGTRALNDLSFVATLIDEYGSDKIVVGIDVKNGYVAINGWQNCSLKKYLDFAMDLKNIGVTEVIFTDIDKDGTLTEPNFEAMIPLIDMGFNVVAAGGVSSLDAVKKLRNMSAYGAIIGKALYEGKLDLSELVKPISGLTKRIIPCLDVKDGRVVKGINFVGLKDAGDPVELGKKYSDEGADELVFLDISASHEGRQNVYEMVRKVAKNVFIPFTVGGGIKSIDEANMLLKSGADKVALNTAAVKNSDLIRQISEKFGSQCTVIAIDAKKVGSKYKIFIKGGREETDLELFDWVKQVEKLGAGEILLTSIDRDGTREGFDIEMLKKVSELVSIPVIASGGAGSINDMKDVLEKGNVDAVLAASLFHYDDVTVNAVKKYLSSNLPVRS